MSDATNTETDAVEAAPEPERLHGALVDRLARPGRCSTRLASSTSPSVKALADDGYAMCVDLTGVDYLGHMARSVARRHRRPSASRSWSTCST